MTKDKTTYYVSWLATPPASPRARISKERKDGPRERTQARTVARWVDLVRAAGVGAKKMKVSLAGVGVVKIGYCKDRRFDSH